MLNNLIPTEIVYIQLWRSRIKATNLTTQNEFDQASFVLIKEQPSNKIITAFGDEARIAHTPDTISFNPLGHPRSLVSDFPVLVELLKRVFAETITSPISPFKRTIAIIHPMEMTEGGLTMLEERGLTEVALDSGIKEAYVYVGSHVSPNQLLGVIRGRAEQVTSTKESADYKKLFTAWILITLLTTTFFLAIGSVANGELLLNGEVIIKHLVIGIIFASIGTVPVLLLRLIKSLLLLIGSK